MRAFHPRLAKLDALRGGSEHLERGAKVVGEALEARVVRDDPLRPEFRMKSAVPSTTRRITLTNTGPRPIPAARGWRGPGEA